MTMKRTSLLLLSTLIIFLCAPLHAQRKKSNATDKKDELPLQAFSFRNIGPAFLSGRIADIAIHPEDDNVWYVAVGSGGVWKTENAGTTWTPLFDQESSYSTGCVTIDPNNPSTIWVGSGEEGTLPTEMGFTVQKTGERAGKTSG